MYKTIILLGMIFSLQPGTAFAQSVDQAPSAAVVAAAQASFSEYGSGASLDYVISTTTSPTQPVSISQSFDPAPGGSLSTAKASYPSAHMARMVTNASFVGTGMTLKSWSYPASNNSFVLTIYLVHVIDATIGDNGGIKGGQNIYIVRAGGKIDYKGHPVEATDPNFDLFSLNTTYIFFGQKISTNVYKVNSDEVLQESNGLVQSSNKRKAHAPFYNGRDTASILREAFDAWQVLPSRALGGQNE